MFGFTEKDVIDSWLKAGEEGRSLNIDCPNAVEDLLKDIERTNSEIISLNERKRKCLDLLETLKSHK